jgi:hypothetical protein
LSPNWSAELEVHPIVTPDGKTLRTLEEAGAYVLEMPETPATKAAAGELMKAAEHGGPFLMIARIAVYKAIYGDERPEPRKRETWKDRRRKLRQ